MTTMQLCRSINEPIREGLSWSERWEGTDHGLIWCWERGRQMRSEQPSLAARANKGELVTLEWKGGAERMKRNTKKSGTLQYLATWQGLKGEDLDIVQGDERVVTCIKSGVSVCFSPNVILTEQ